MNVLTTGESYDKNTIKTHAITWPRYSSWAS